MEPVDFVPVFRLAILVAVAHEVTFSAAFEHGLITLLHHKVSMFPQTVVAVQAFTPNWDYALLHLLDHPGEFLYESSPSFDRFSRMHPV